MGAPFDARWRATSSSQSGADHPACARPFAAFDLGLPPGELGGLAHGERADGCRSHPRARGSSEQRDWRGGGDQRLSLRAVLDLAPMFLGASAIRALLGSGLTLRGGFVEQLGGGSVLAAELNNLPAAAAVHAIGATGRRAAVLAMAIGSNLLVTGSVATLICRRIARDAGVQFGAARFSLLGLAFVPL
jgi:hypothetical protein